uniref:NodB homology domain-containing protein n=1 Tax=candidate division WOR-3 bacterium TaxID=2052148 RepID=A0A7V5XZZ5_UNCW3
MKKINFWVLFLLSFIFLLFLLTAFYLTKLVVGKADYFYPANEETKVFSSFDTLYFSFKDEEPLPLTVYIIVNKDFIFDKEITILKEILEKIPEINYEIVEAKKIEDLKPGLIVLLGKTNYDNKIAEIIKKKVYEGGGILLIKNPQTKENISLLSHIAGVIPIEQEDTGYQEIYLKGETPITYNMKVGDFLGITGEKIYFLKPVEKRVNVGGYYKCGKEAIVYGYYNKGRYVAFGFSFTSLTGDSFTQNNIKKLLINTIYWLSKRPIIQLKYWPNDKEYAFIFSCDVEHRGENWFLIKKIIPKGTFFFLAPGLKDFKENNFNNIEFALHGTEHEPLKGKGYKEQEKIILDGKKYLEKRLKKKIFGFHPPLLEYDSLTLAILKNAGFSYILSEYKLGLPFLPYYSLLITIPQTIPDDYDLMVRNNIKDKDSLFLYYQKYIENLKKINGLIVFSIHTHLLGSSEYLPVVKKIVDLVKDDKNCYFASAKEVSEWWLKRSNVKIEFDINNPKEILIENLNKEPLAGVTLKYYPQSNQIIKGDTLIFINKLAGKEKRIITLIYSSENP